MKVIINNEVNFIDWQYDGESTSCILRRANKEIVTTSAIKKYHLDEHNKDLARRISLRKLLDTTFPGFDGKKTREIVWKSYINRK